MKYLAAKSTATSAAPQERLTAARRVTVAEFLNLAAAPIELVPAPGPGKLIVPIALIASGEGGAGYNGNPNICYGGNPALGPIFAGFSSAFGYEAPFLAISGSDNALRDAAENAALVLVADPGPVTDGDYDIEIRIEYEIVTL